MTWPYKCPQPVVSRTDEMKRRVARRRAWERRKAMPARGPIRYHRIAPSQEGRAARRIAARRGRDAATKLRLEQRAFYLAFLARERRRAGARR